MEPVPGSLIPEVIFVDQRPRVEAALPDLVEQQSGTDLFFMAGTPLFAKRAKNKSVPLSRT